MESFRRVVKTLSPDVRATLRRRGVVREALDDAEQEVWANLWKAWQRLRTQSADQTKGYARSILKGVASMLRHERCFPSTVCAVEVEAHVEELVEAHRVAAWLAEAMPAPILRAWIATEVEGASRAEISRALGVPPGQVVSLLRRARGILKRKLPRWRSKGGGADSVPTSAWLGIFATAEILDQKRAPRRIYFLRDVSNASSTHTGIRPQKESPKCWRTPRRAFMASSVRLQFC
jgi:RNA polymerase sigma factor (sigma-70 family)